MSSLTLEALMAAAPSGSRFSEGFEQLVNQMRHEGPKQLMVITDFDQTSPGPRHDGFKFWGLKHALPCCARRSNQDSR